MTYNVDVILTLWDRTTGHVIYNSGIIPRFLDFLNYQARIVAQIDQPTPNNLELLNSLKDEGKIHEVHVARHPPDHSPKDVNTIYLQAFRHVKNDWVVHMDGDMFFYRRGHDDWLERFIKVIENREHRIGAICNTSPYRRYNPYKQYVEYRPQTRVCVSTRFFVTEAETVLEAVDTYRFDGVPADDVYHIPFGNGFLVADERIFEGVMYEQRITRLGLISLGLPFDPGFLVLHIAELAWWEESFWNDYTREIANRNETLLMNVSHSDWGDICGDRRDFTTPEVWGKGSWSTKGYDGEVINPFNIIIRE